MAKVKKTNEKKVENSSEKAEKVAKKVKKRPGNTYAIIYFANKIANKTGSQRATTYKFCRRLMRLVTKRIVAMPVGDRVHLHGLGTFSKKVMKERKSRNPHSGQALLVPAREKIVFRLANELRVHGKLPAKAIDKPKKVEKKDV